MKIAICDDNQNDLHKIEDYCKAFNPDGFCCAFSSSVELLDAFENEYFDIVLLDIEMAPPNGYEAGIKLMEKSRKPLIIFITNTVNYAVCGYEVAFRYLTKPLSYPTFFYVLRDAEKCISTQKILLSCSNKESYLVAYTDICYFESYNRKVSFHLNDETRIIVPGKISDYKKLLDGSYFIQIHKSYCINLNYVDYVKNSHVFLNNGITLPVSRSRQTKFLNALENHFK